MNKLDLLPEIKRESLIDTGDVVHVSAAKGIGMDRLLQRIDELIEQDPVRQVRLRVPQSEGKALATLDAKAVVTVTRVSRRLRRARSAGAGVGIAPGDKLYRQVRTYCRFFQ